MLWFVPTIRTMARMTPEERRLYEMLEEANNPNTPPGELIAGLLVLIVLGYLAAWVLL